MTGLANDNLTSTEILPVKCPGCGEAQNTLEGAADPFAPEARIGCMVCNYLFDAEEYRTLLDERLREFNTLRIGDL